MNGLYDELRIALHSVWTRRWLVLGVAWGICLAGWLMIAMIPNAYESRARIVVQINDILPEASASGGMSNQQQIDQIRQTLTSARNMEKVAVATGLIAADAGDRDKQDVVGFLQKNIKIIAQQDNIFELIAVTGVGSLSDADNAKLASAVLDSLITVFREEQLRGGQMSARDSLKFLDGQMIAREKSLRDVEARRAAFEAANIGMIPGGVGSPAIRLEQLRSELTQIEGQLAAAQGGLAAANGQMAGIAATIATPGLNSTGGGVARQQLGGARAELSAMRARGLTDAHPDVMALKAQIDALAAQAAREGTNAGGTAPNPAYASLAAMRAERQATVGALSARKAQLNGEITQITARRIAEPGIASEYERLNGDYRVQKDQYDRLLAQREAVRLRGEVASETDAIRVDLTDPPTKPRAPVAPNRPLFLALVLFAGIGGGIGTAFGLGQMRATYPTAGKLERASGLPVIGSITEVVTPARHADRNQKLVWLAGGSVALVALFALLLVVEFVQRGMVA
jgi:polysaccharide chain length determinant protein (PEP-CTERM system associated)